MIFETDSERRECLWTITLRTRYLVELAKVAAAESRKQVAASQLLSARARRLWRFRPSAESPEVMGRVLPFRRRRPAPGA